MLAYKPGNSMLYRLHPAALLVYLAAVVTASLLVNNPLYLLAIMAGVLCCIFAAGGQRDWCGNLKYLLMMAALLFCINLLVNNMGRTILWQGFSLPLLGRVKITLEAVAFSLVMCLRLIIIYSVFAFISLVLNPDSALSLFAGILPRSTLLVSLTTKSIPYLAQRLERAAEIQQCRGISFHQGGYMKRLSSRIPLVKVVLLSSLEDSFNIGESLQARAFGQGVRTRYFTFSIKILDILVIAGAMAGIAIAAWSLRHGNGAINFFPVIDSGIITRTNLIISLLVFLFLLVPAAAAWGYEKWELLKSKI